MPFMLKKLHMYKKSKVSVVHHKKSRQVMAVSPFLLGVVYLHFSLS